MSVMVDGEALIKRTSITELVAAWRQCEADIIEAYRLLVASEERLDKFFGSDHYFSLERLSGRGRTDTPDYQKPQETLAHLKKTVWGVLINRMELKRVLSIKAVTELDAQIESGEGLPDITEEGVQGLLKGTMEQIPKFIEDAIKEVFEILTPYGHWTGDRYVTNSAFKVNRRVIITWAVERKWSGGGYRVRYGTEKLRALDRVFHALDGNGSAAVTYQGELVDSIEAANSGEGETQYFRWRAYHNGNLHVEFKRQDLLDELNSVACGKALDWQKGKRGEKERSKNDQ